MEILFILVVITFDELPGWLYLQSVLYLYWGQTQVKVWNSASTCEPAAQSQWDWKVSVGSFVSLPAGLDPGSHLNWDYWALNVSQITAAFHVWVHCAAPSARPSQQTLTSGLPVQVQGSVGKHLILIWVISCPPPHAPVVPSQTHRDRNRDHHDWIWTVHFSFEPFWTVLRFWSQVWREGGVISWC